ncbi:MAG: FMN-binding negative transcriptional regulator [Planctomycetes bacterium]|nr:FMN-binding negative transcriptional regulator [Planctomycetota bacterium]
MYIPAAFRQPDRSRLHDFIERHGFAVLVSQQQGALEASHLPLLLEREAGPEGCLWGHMARANSQWRQAGGTEVLVIFSGPHAYVSPTWYQAEQVVPTWNYTAVHASGRLELVEEPDRLLPILRQQVERYESSFPQPWSFDPASEFVVRLMKSIVGFRIEITRLEGKWKLSQNHPRERRERVIGALRASGNAEQAEIAALMQSVLHDSGELHR